MVRADLPVRGGGRADGVERAALACRRLPRDGRLLALLAALGVGWLGTLALFGQDPVARYLTIAWTGVMALWIACARRTD